MPKLKFREATRGDLHAWCDMKEALFTVHIRGGGYLAKMISKRKGIIGVERRFDTAPEAKSWLEETAVRIGATCTEPPPPRKRGRRLSDDFSMEV